MNQVTETVELSRLESHLWESASILRGPVDAADFKPYIFPLLFFKRICNVWDEEYQGWQETQAGEREVKKALRKALFKYKLHADEDLFEKAYSYIRQYY